MSRWLIAMMMASPTTWNRRWRIVRAKRRHLLMELST